MMSLNIACVGTPTKPQVFVGWVRTLVNPEIPTPLKGIYLKLNGASIL